MSVNVMNKDLIGFEFLFDLVLFRERSSQPQTISGETVIKLNRDVV